MLGLIIRKEILENLLNSRFVAALIVSVVLVVTSVILLTLNHEEEMRDYEKRVEQQERFTDEFSHLNRINWMTRPMRMPSKLQTLVLGIDREADQENFISNPIPVLFCRLDLVSIVTIIMSLMAILFSYNAICGEREAGMLRQMLSMGVSRATLLVGKYIGGNLSLLVPFTIGMLAGLITIALSSTLEIQPADYLVFLVLVAGSWLYTMAFYGLGMLFSASSQTSGVSILKSLFLWVILVLVIPNVSPFLAAQFTTMPSVARVEKERNRILSEERDDILRQEQRKMLQTTFADIAWIRDISQQELQSRIDVDPQFRKRMAEYAKAYDAMVSEVNQRQRQKDDLFEEDFSSRASRQQLLATILASLSPSTNFIFLATDVTETGIQGESQFRDVSNRYQNALEAYANAKYQKEKEKNPGFESNDYLDLKGRPRFQYQPEPLIERAEAILPQVGLLIIFNLLFVGIGLRSFLMYDVR